MAASWRSRICSRRGSELDEGLAAGPCVLTAPHCSVAEVGVAVDAGVLEDLLLYGHRSLEQVGMGARTSRSHSAFALVEAEIASRAGPPLVVGGKADPGIVEDPHDARVVDAVLHEREEGLDVGLGGDIALAVGLISADRHVGNGRLLADPLLDGLDLHVLRAPAHLR